MKIESIDLTDPKQARKYCEEFEVPGKGRITYVQLSTGRKVELKTMSDEDAVDIAHGLYEMQLEGERLAAQDNGAIQ